VLYPSLRSTAIQKARTYLSSHRPPSAVPLFVPVSKRLNVSMIQKRITSDLSRHVLYFVYRQFDRSMVQILDEYLPQLVGITTSVDNDELLLKTTPSTPSQLFLSKSFETVY
jgi:hypothetical protein